VSVAGSNSLHLAHGDHAATSRHEEEGIARGDVFCDGISPDAVTVPISSLLPGESPRLEGEDKTHVARLAAMEVQLPPVLVDRRRMRVIDGMHRLLAASLNGRDTIEVRFFDGHPADAFLHAVKANVTHGLPLSQTDRRVAAERIVESHPHLSDRTIAQLAGLSAKTVGSIRRRSAGAVPQADSRIGKDGRVRPLNALEGRRRAAELITAHPQASLREVARKAGVSPGTVRDVRKRLERGDEPAPVRRGASAGLPSPVPAKSGAQRAVRAMRQAPGFVLDKLLRDPSLRHNEQGRLLLRWLQHNPATPHERSSVVAAVPPHCAALVVQLARQNAQVWLDFAQELDQRVRVIDPWAGRQISDRCRAP
jgi:ParB-like chromosome segregation protein Spo0J